MRGLKPVSGHKDGRAGVVAPSRVRGLKPVSGHKDGRAGVVAPSRVRGLKRLPPRSRHRSRRRTLTGAWIETALKTSPNGIRGVAPSRVRGLKQDYSPLHKTVTKKLVLFVDNYNKSQG